MFKKYKLIVALVTLYTISSAVSFETIRLGFNIGNSHLEAKLKALENLNVQKLKKDSYYAGVFMGYDHLIPETPLFVGIEGELSNHIMEVNARKDYDTDLIASLKLVSNNSKIASLRLGLSINQSLIYGKVGIAQTNFNIRVTTPKGILYRKKEKLGMVMGAGLEVFLNKNYSVGIEHTFNDYNAIERIHPKTMARLIPTIHVTKLRLVYSF